MASGYHWVADRFYHFKQVEPADTNGALLPLVWRAWQNVTAASSLLCGRITLAVITFCSAPTESAILMPILGRDSIRPHLRSGTSPSFPIYAIVQRARLWCVCLAAPILRYFIIFRVPCILSRIIPLYRFDSETPLKKSVPPSCLTSQGSSLIDPSSSPTSLHSILNSQFSIPISMFFSGGGITLSSFSPFNVGSSSIEFLIMVIAT